MASFPRTPLLVLVSLLAASLAFAQTAPNPSGHWEGQIQIPDHVLAMTLDLAKSPAGAWIGSMTIPSSTDVDVPLDTVTVDAAAVRFTALLPGHTSFEGSLSADARGLAGTASNAEGGVPFQLTRGGRGAASRSRRRTARCPPASRARGKARSNPAARRGESGCGCRAPTTARRGAR